MVCWENHGPVLSGCDARAILKRVPDRNRTVSVTVHICNIG